MKENRFALPNSFNIPIRNGEYPFPTQEELKRREANRERVEREQDRRTHGFGDFRFRSGPARTREDIRRIK